MFTKLPLDNKKIMLRNGTTEPQEIFIKTLRSLAHLLYHDRMALYELIQRCRNRGHRNLLIDNERLKPLVDDDGGVVSKSVCNVILACIDDHGLELVPVDPIGSWVA